MGVKFFYLSNGYKIIFGVQWMKKYFTSQMGVKKFEVSKRCTYRCKNILGVK